MTTTDARAILVTAIIRRERVVGGDVILVCRGFDDLTRLPAALLVAGQYVGTGGAGCSLHLTWFSGILGAGVLAGHPAR